MYNSFSCYFKVSLPELKILFPDLVHNHAQEHGVCYAKAWPQLTTKDMDVLTDDSCAITKGPVTDIDTYTTGLHFTLDNINSSCQRISCVTKLTRQVKYINIYLHVSFTEHTTTSTSTGTINVTPGLTVILPEPSEPNV